MRRRTDGPPAASRTAATPVWLTKLKPGDKVLVTQHKEDDWLATVKTRTPTNIVKLVESEASFDATGRDRNVRQYDYARHLAQATPQALAFFEKAKMIRNLAGLRGDFLAKRSLAQLTAAWDALESEGAPHE